MKTCDFCEEFSENTPPKGCYGFIGSRVIASDGCWNLVPTLGCFLDGYSLLINTKHRPSLYHCTHEEKELFSSFLNIIKEVYSRAYNTNVFMFEHGIVDESKSSPTSVDHVHLHFIPFHKNYRDISRIIQEDYNLKEIVFSDIFEIEQIIQQHGIKTYLLYFYDELFRLVNISDQELQSQFMRKIVYETTGQKERDGWNWKSHEFRNNMRKTYDALSFEFDHITSSIFDERAASYENESEWIKNTKFINPMVPAPFGNGFFLDIACGTGILSETAQKLGWIVTSVDCCQEMLDEVDNSITKVLCNAERLPFANNSYDMVVCRQGLQYMNLHSALSEMIRVSSHEIILLHATVPDEDVATWKSIYRKLGHIDKYIFSSFEIPKMINCHFNNLVSIYQDELLYSYETIKIPSDLQVYINNILATNIGFVNRNHAELINDQLHYKLEWHLIKISKQRGSAYENIQ